MSRTVLTSLPNVKANPEISSAGCTYTGDFLLSILYLMFLGLLNSKRLSLKIKVMVYRSCVRSAMLYESETWCLRVNEMAILRRTERAIVRALCGAKLMEKKRTGDLMEMLRLKETVVQMAKSKGVRWYGHVLRRDYGYVLRKALSLK